MLRIIGSVKDKLRDSKPTSVVIYGYLTYIALGTILLLLPFSQVNTVGLLDNLFVSTSAVSTTGLSEDSLKAVPGGWILTATPTAESFALQATASGHGPAY